MKRKFLFIAGLLVVLSFVSCNGFSNYMKHTESSWVGIKRTIVSFPPNLPARVITTTSQVEYNGGAITFIDDQNKTHSWPANLTWVDEE